MMDSAYTSSLGLSKEDYARALQVWFMDKTSCYLNLRNPTTFNEKIQWLKLYDSTPLKTKTTDKYLVREWIKEKIGEKYLIPLLGVYDNFDEIDFDNLPKKFVMKTNHGSGWNKVVLDKTKLNIGELRIKFQRWLNTNFAFVAGFELHYKDIKPKIIIEKYIENKGGVLFDYKFWCFNGEPKYIQFRNDWKSDLKMAFFDTDWSKQEFYYDHPLYEENLEKPDNLDEMLRIAKELCQGFMFVCVDLYRLDNGQIYFGEMTYTRSSGIGNWHPAMWNKKLGEMIVLPENREEIMKKYDYKINFEPKISVIVPVYNVEKYLPKCLDSLVNQTLLDIEIICVNDGSTDGCAQILQEYKDKDSRIVVLNQINKGQGAARNCGLEIAKGKYIQFLDSDDYYAHTCCEEMYDIMEKNEDVDVACFGTNVIYETYENLKESDDAYFKVKWLGKKKVNPQMIRSFSVNCWDKIFRKSFIDKYALRFPEGIRVSEDFCFFWQWMINAKYLYFCKSKLVNYLRREGSSIDRILRHKNVYSEETFYTDKQIYDYLVQNNKWETYKTQYIKAYIYKLNWLIKCFSLSNWQDKRKIIDEYSSFLSQFNISDFDLEENEEYLYRMLLNKNYFAFNAYNNYEIEEVHPIYSKGSINLVFSTDKNYISYLAVTIESIIENSSRQNNYDIIVMYSDVYEYQKRFILSLAEKYSNVTIRLFNMTEYVKKYELDKLFTANHITLSAYFRLFVGKIFTEYNKVLYLDCDLVINRDIAELFYMDIDEYPVAAALDTVVSNNLENQGFSDRTWKNFRKYMSDTLGFFDVEHYFNSGVMIIDIAKFNSVEFDYLVDIAKRNNRFFHDQNVMNVAFENNYYLLPQIWNLQWHVKFFFYDYKKELPVELIELYDSPDVLPAIIHYTSHEKPWKNPLHTFADVWWKYARNTPFYEIFMRDMYKTSPQQKESTLSDKNLDLIFYQHNKLEYWKYKILSKITFGKKNKKYKEKKRLYKYKVKTGKEYFQKNGDI